MNLFKEMQAAWIFLSDYSQKQGQVFDDSPNKPFYQEAVRVALSKFSDSALLHQP